MRNSQRAADPWTGGHFAPSIPPDKPHEPALNVDLIRAKDAGLVVRIGSLKRNGRTLLAKTLECRFLLLNQRNDDIAIFGGLAALDYDDVAVMNAGLNHRIAAHLEREVLAVAQRSEERRVGREWKWRR